MKYIPRLFLTGILCLISRSLCASETVQVELGSLLNARIVTTLSDNRLVTWPDSLDNAGSGMATQAAAAHMGDATAKALPDDGVFPATARHPLVRLNFSNARATGNQVRRSIGEDSYELPVPARRYTRLDLFCMSGMGPSSLTVLLRYADGTVDTRVIEAPDWWNSMPPTDALRYDLAVNLGKWDDKNRMMEPDHHYITGLQLQPDARRVLVSLRISKTAPGVLTLWGVTGLAE